ncbi:MAG: hypothetical protein ACYSWU_17055 [Planctomycetota bacterium]|jgi:hypothetical protein
MDRLTPDERQALLDLLGDSPQTAAFLASVDLLLDRVKQRPEREPSATLKERRGRERAELKAVADGARDLKQALESASSTTWALVGRGHYVETGGGEDGRALSPLDPSGAGGKSFLAALGILEAAAGTAASFFERGPGRPPKNPDPLIALLAVGFRASFPQWRISSEPKSYFFRALEIFLPDRLFIAPATLGSRIDKVRKPPA